MKMSFEWNSYSDSIDKIDFENERMVQLITQFNSYTDFFNVD